MKENIYKEMLGKVLDILHTVGVIDNIDWGSFSDNSEILNLIIKDKIYCFEKSADNSKIEISIEYLEEE